MRIQRANTNAEGANSVQSLIDKLKDQPRTTSLAARIQAVEHHSIHWRDVQKYVVRNPDHYHRQPVETNERFQLLFLTWLPGQKSEIHNHRGSQCIVRVLQGVAMETVYVLYEDNSFSGATSLHNRGSVIGGEDSDIHAVENPMNATKDLVTMHVYFPMLKQMEVFTVKDGRLLLTA